MSVEGEHTIHCCGAKVRVSRKSIDVLTEPTVNYCPLHEALYGTKGIDKKSVSESVKAKIANFGFCCANRLFDDESIVPYGASEMMKVWLNKGLIDCAVIVCEGAGTVITSNGRLVQSIGARLTGIVKTSPIPKIIEQIRADKGIVLDEATALINQAEGLKRAISMGHKRIAVSIAGFQAKTIGEIRKIEANSPVDILVFSVCNTCVDEAAVKHIRRADIACASASKLLRTEVGGEALLQLGVTIPVFALTEKGKRLVLAYLSEFKDRLVVFRVKELPYQAENKGPRLKGSELAEKSG